MLFVPFSVMVTWPIPNYINPERRPKEILIASFLFLLLATAVVSLRVWTRVTIRRFIGADDFLVIFALVCSAAVTTMSAIGLLRYDWDRHEWNLPLSLVPDAIKIYYVARIFWVAATTAVRMSVLLLYYRLLYACQASRRYYVVLHVFTGFTIFVFTAFLLVFMFPCRPVRGYWDWNMPDPKCINDWVVVMVAAIVNTFSEFIVATLPLTAVFFLQVDKRQRWNVVALLSLGFFVAVVGCIRCVYIWKALISYDLTWWAGPGWVIANVEIDVALMCSCAAPLSPHIARLWRRMRGLPLKPRARRTPKSLEIVVKHTNTYSQDYEAVAEWAAIMSRTIDIEGIANDGLGYSVTITGPISSSAKPRRTPSKLRKSASAQFQHTQRSMKSRERKSSRWRIPSEVLEPGSWSSTVFKKMESGDRAISPSTVTADNIEIALDAFSDPTVLNPTPHVPRDDSEALDGAPISSKNLYSFYLEDESAEHLPLPAQTRQVQRHAGVLELIRPRKPDK